MPSMPVTGRRALLAGLILLVPSVVLGQPPPAQVPNPALPATVPEEQLTNHIGLLNTILGDVFMNAGGPPAHIMTISRNLWRGFAVILIAWTGFQTAFGGGVRAWSLFRLVLNIVIPLWMIETYTTPIPGVGLPFPLIIPEGANAIGGHFVQNVPGQMFQAFGNLITNVSNTLTDMWGNLSLLNLWRTGMTSMYSLIVAAVALPLFCLLLILVFCFAYAQVLYALVVINILVFLGPVFIPFFIFQPLSFLFWGWLRCLFVYSFYSVVAGAMLYVWSSVGLVYVNTFITATIDPSSLGWSVVWFVGIVPLAVAAILSSTKVGEIAAGLVSGSAGGGMNVAGLATTGLMMATGGAGKIAAIAGKPR